MIGISLDRYFLTQTARSNAGSNLSDVSCFHCLSKTLLHRRVPLKSSSRRDQDQTWALRKVPTRRRHQDLLQQSTGLPQTPSMSPDHLVFHHSNAQKRQSPRSSPLHRHTSLLQLPSSIQDKLKNIGKNGSSSSWSRCAKKGRLTAKSANICPVDPREPVRNNC